MSAVDRNDLIAFTAGSIAGESPLSLEDAVAAALRLVDEFDDHGWTMHADRDPVDEDEIRLEFDPALVPKWLTLGGVQYDVVPRSQPTSAEDLAVRFDEVESASPPVAEPEEVETSNDLMVSIQGSGETARLRWLGSDGVSRETALRHAAWIVAMTDPLDELFGKILAAVRST